MDAAYTLDHWFKREWTGLFLSQIELKTFSELRLSSSFKRFICSLFAMLTMSSVTNHFNNDLSTASKKMPRYSAELVRQMDDLFNALYHFHGMFVHGVVRLSFINKFLSDQWLPYVSINMISMHSWCEREDFYVVYYMLGPGFLCFFSANQRRVNSWAT